MAQVAADCLRETPFDGALAEVVVAEDFPFDGRRFFACISL
jgi:hypothetical protein